MSDNTEQALESQDISRIIEEKIAEALAKGKKEETEQSQRITPPVAEKINLGRIDNRSKGRR